MHVQPVKLCDKKVDLRNIKEEKVTLQGQEHWIICLVSINLCIDLNYRGICKKDVGSIHASFKSLIGPFSSFYRMPPNKIGIEKQNYLPNINRKFADKLGAQVFLSLQSIT